MKIETIVLDKDRGSELVCYIQDEADSISHIDKRPAVMVMPGGGYRNLAKTEGEPVVFPYLYAGYHAFLLRYSICEHAVWPNPLSDFEKAMDIIRENADKWRIFTDKIAVAGFSAGGHLALAAATCARIRPNAAILGYPVTGDHVKAALPSAPNLVSLVDKDTCPCFVVATRTDDIVDISNSIELMDALNKNEIPFECHIYSYGPHAFSTCMGGTKSVKSNASPRIPGWVNESIGWLSEMFGEFKEGGMSPSALEIGGFGTVFS